MANFNFNKVIIGGRLVADPELKQTQSGLPVTTFSVAVNKKTAKDGAQKADFFQITAWRGTAEMVAKYLKKGSSVCIVGCLSNSFYEDKDGNRRGKTEITAEEITFIDTKAEAAEKAISSGANGAEPPEYSASDGDSLPF